MGTFESYKMQKQEAEFRMSQETEFARQSKTAPGVNAGQNKGGPNPELDMGASDGSDKSEGGF